MIKRVGTHTQEKIHSHRYKINIFIRNLKLAHEFIFNKKGTETRDKNKQ